MANVCVFLADGFEEVEALIVVDLLRRASINVEMVSTKSDLRVTGAHGIAIYADSLFREGAYADCDMMFLPGGMPGTSNLIENEELAHEIRRFEKGGKYLAAICAAPSVYGNLGLLKGKKATCYPGFEDRLIGAQIVADKVVRDGIFLTSRGAGTAMDMALEIIKIFEGQGKADEIAKSIIYNV